MNADMKNTSNIESALCLVLFLTMVLTSCAERECTRGPKEKRKQFVSASYNHFEQGQLFTDVVLGLNVLWDASFRYGNPYKENVGFFVADGLIINPNTENRSDHGKLTALPLNIVDGQLFITLRGIRYHVLAIVHTHPEPFSLPMPTPRNDYQFGYLGIHNYIMDQYNLFDAYKNEQGEEVYNRLGRRTAYNMIPLLIAREMETTSRLVLGANVN